jgi:integrase/recombinase XerD
MTRTPPRKKAKQLARYLRDEQPDYVYLKSVFKHLREQLDIAVPRTPKSLPRVPDVDELKRLHEAFWQSGRTQDMLIFRTLLYTGVRVGELVHIQLQDVDVQQHQIRIQSGKGNKDRVVPFPVSFREVLAVHVEKMTQQGATFLFESNRQAPYSERGIRKMFARYSQKAQLDQTISPHQLRHFLLLWLKKQGIDDALIQPYSGHASRQSLEVYSQLALREAQQSYDLFMKEFPL